MPARLPSQLYGTVDIDLLTEIIAAASSGMSKSPARLPETWADKLLLRLLSVQTKNRAIGGDLTGLQEERRRLHATHIKDNDKHSFDICTWFLSLHGARIFKHYNYKSQPLLMECPGSYKFDF